MKNITLILLVSVIYFLGSCSPKNIPLANSEKLTNNRSDTAIVFVHGFMGDSKNTWTNDESKAYWPKLMTKGSIQNNLNIFVVHDTIYA